MKIAKIFILCFAYSHCASPGFEEEEKEEKFFNAGNIQDFLEQTGKDHLLILPGIPPTTGAEAISKALKWIQEKGIQRVNTTIIKEMCLGDYYLEIASYTVHDGSDKMSDEGTVLKFYKWASGKLKMVVNFTGSKWTPWPVIKA